MSVIFNKLPCGILTGCDSMNNVESVALKIMIKVGGMHENPKNYGLSHFVEHMAFKGTKKRNKFKIASELDELGGSFNAYTGKEHTCYLCRVPKKYIEEAFDVLSDIILNSTFEESEIELEREVIHQEISMYEDSPEDKLSTEFYTTSFQNQSFGASILGPVKNILKFKRDDFIKYIDDYYTNDNTIIAAAGNTTFEELAELTEYYFKNRPKTTTSTIQKPEFTGGKCYIKKDLEQTQILFGFPSMKKSDPNYYKVQIASLILGGGMSSRLFQEIRENLGLAYSVSTHYSAYKNCGLFSVYGGVDPKNANLFIKESIKEIKKCINNITKDELERVKKQLRCAILMSTDGTSSRASHLLSSLDVYGRYVSNEEILDHIEKTTIDDVKLMIRNALANDKATFSCIGKNIEKNVMNYNEFLSLLKN
jgi:predicted Zn-dependent peptidase